MIRKVKDECLEKVLGGRIYHVIHNGNCRFGNRCNLKKFPWIVTKGNIPLEKACKHDVIMLGDFQSALRTELGVNLEKMDPTVHNVMIDKLLHIAFEIQQICESY